MNILKKKAITEMRKSYPKEFEISVGIEELSILFEVALSLIVEEVGKRK